MAEPVERLLVFDDFHFAVDFEEAVVRCLLIPEQYMRIRVVLDFIDFQRFFIRFRIKRVSVIVENHIAAVRLVAGYRRHHAYPRYIQYIFNLFNHFLSFHCYHLCLKFSTILCGPNIQRSFVWGSKLRWESNGASFGDRSSAGSLSEPRLGIEALLEV